MATITLDERRNYLGALKRNKGTYTGPASYATGGEAVTAAELGLADVIEDVFFEAINDGGYVARWKHSTGKVKVFYSDDNDTNDGPLIEVAAATDLSGQAFRFAAEGN